MRALICAIGTVLLGSGACVQAAVSIETVTVGDPGNAADTTTDGTTGYGSVPYTYNIGKYEVTAGQYCAFLNAVAATDTYGLYNSGMYYDSHGCKITRSGTSGSYSYSVAGDWANRPANFVSFWDACRLANWLNNGQPIGAQDAFTTEDGAYTLNGYNNDDGRSISRNAEAKWYIPNEDEWYKAAYYKAGGIDTGYWDYPMQSDGTGGGCPPTPVTVPSNDLADPDPGNNANFNQDGYTLGSPFWRTNVGEFENSGSAYGTYDQGGNVSEWTESVNKNPALGSYRVFRGGCFSDGDYALLASDRHSTTPRYEYYYSGFRVASTVPEPSSTIALLGGLTGLVGLKRRKARV